MRDNKFAELSPEYEEDEIQRKKNEREARMKNMKGGNIEPKITSGDYPIPDTNTMQIISQTSDRGRGQRGQYRGSRRTGGYGARYIPKGEQRDPKDTKFAEYTDQVYPYDRPFGASRGSEISKRGAEIGNWGIQHDELKYGEVKWPNEDETYPTYYKAPPKEVAPEAKEPVDIPAEEKQEEKPRKERKQRKDKRKGKFGDNKEEKHEDLYDPNGTAMTYKEYQEMIEKKKQEVALKKPELRPIEAKKLEGVQPIEKKDFNKGSEKAVEKKKKPEEEKVESHLELLGGFIPKEERQRGSYGGRRRRGRYRDNLGEERKAEDKPAIEPIVVTVKDPNAPVTAEAVPEEAHEEEYRGRGTRRRGRGERRYHNEPRVEKEKEKEKTAFKLDLGEFPSLK